MNSSRRIIFFLLLFAEFFLTIPQSVCADEVATPAAKTDYGIIAGEWLRTDGGYLIRVSDVQPDGQATVEYFNPRSIHVAQAAISTQKGLIKLFIKFLDKGYEGSTYKLYYYAEKDALLGFYYQAGMDKTFEVVFLKKTK
ncbi:MAG: hypothetical protein U9R66_04325 [Thermodesulfobacteriota bacterium]|nr:hypothetical protein [Thermodesulfobacteriota bacterium]